MIRHDRNNSERSSSKPQAPSFAGVSLASDNSLEGRSRLALFIVCIVVVIFAIQLLRLQVFQAADNAAAGQAARASTTKRCTAIRRSFRICRKRRKTLLPFWATAWSIIPIS